jgi:hypothetical protein
MLSIEKKQYLTRDVIDSGIERVDNAEHREK